jgi:hypothetical protein
MLIVSFLMRGSSVRGAADNGGEGISAFPTS